MSNASRSLLRTRFLFQELSKKKFPVFFSATGSSMSCANAAKRAKEQIFQMASNGDSWEFESTIESAYTLSCLTLMAVKNLFRNVLFHYNWMNDECKKEILLHRDDYGNTIMHYFALRDNRDILTYFEKECKKLNVYTCVEMKNNAGECPCKVMQAGRISMFHKQKNACPFWLFNDGCSYIYCRCNETDQVIAPDDPISAY